MLHANSASDCKDSLLPLLDAPTEAARFADFTAQWHVADTHLSNDDLLLKLHRSNYELWHLEDRARDPHATDAVIAEVKRAIDGTNQRRNDLVERVDDALMQALTSAGLPNAAAPLHSETPGMILDRLSILSLKVFHTTEEAERTDAEKAHRERNRQRLTVIRDQSNALVDCLAVLWQEIVRGERRFQLYRQMKMYNDPTLNPVLYAASGRRPMGGS